MKRLLSLIILFWAAVVFGQGQNFPLPASGSLPQVTSNPVCPPTGAGLYLNTATNQLLQCNNGVLSTATGSWGQSVDVTLFGAKFDVQASFSATLNSTATVVTGANDPAFVCPGAAFPCSSGGDVGKIAFAVHAAASGNVTATDCPDTTISQVTAAHTAVLAAACTASGTSQFVWGHDDTTAIQAADTAANASCGNVLLPAGSTFVNAGFGNTSQASYCLIGGGGARTSKSWLGAGRNVTRIIPRPSFNFSTSTSCNGILISTYNGCFMSSLNTNIYNLMIWGVNYGPSGNTRNVAAITMGQSGKNSTMQNVEVNMWNATDTTTVGIAAIGSATGLINVEVDGAGNSPLYAGGGWLTITGSPCFFGDTPTGVQFAGSATLPTMSSGCVYSSDVLTGISQVSVIGGLNSTNDTFGSFNQTQAGVRCLSVGGTGVVNIVNGQVDCSSSPTGAFAMTMASGGIIRATQTQFKATNTTGTDLFIPAGATFIDNGGNTFLTTSASSIAGSFLNEANSANQVLVTAAKLVLSANWGTSAADSALSGGNSPIQFTITNGSAATGASPTITYTFPTPYKMAPFSCTATQTGGTNAVGTFATSSLTATGAVFTFSLTPTASSTEIVLITCVIP